MNVTLTDAEEVWLKKDKKRVELGRILLKGDNIVSLLSPAADISPLLTLFNSSCRHSFSPRNEKELAQSSTGVRIETAISQTSMDGMGAASARAVLCIASAGANSGG